MASVEYDETVTDSTYNVKNGRYARGGKTEVSSKFAEWWERAAVEHDISDTLYALEQKYVGRPDLLAYTFYGDSRLKWVIMQYNDVLDPDELIAGKLLLMPSPDKISITFPAAKPGGVSTTAVGSI